MSVFQIRRSCRRSSQETRLTKFGKLRTDLEVTKKISSPLENDTWNWYFDQQGTDFILRMFFKIGLSWPRDSHNVRPSIFWRRCSDGPYELDKIDAGLSDPIRMKIHQLNISNGYPSGHIEEKIFIWKSWKCFRKFFKIFKFCKE